MMYALLLASCGDTTLGTSRGSLTVTPFPESRYLATQTTPTQVTLPESITFAQTFATFRLTNDGNQATRVERVSVAGDLVEDWPAVARVRVMPLGEPLDESSVDDEADRLIVGQTEISIAPSEQALLWLPFFPQQDRSTSSAVFTLLLGQDERLSLDLEVVGSSRTEGSPVFEIGIGSVVGPQANDCITDVCTLPTFSFGNIGLGRVGRQTLTMRNRAQCAEQPGIDTCTRCTLTITDIRVEGGDADAFVFEGSVNTPVSLYQDASKLPSECNDRVDLEGFLGEASLSVRVQAPNQPQTLATTLVVVTNAPGAREVRVPIEATSIDAPLAHCDVVTSPVDRVPLSTVTVTGASSVPSPTRPGPLQYAWSVERLPRGANPVDIVLNPAVGGESQFVPTVAGRYDIRLVALDASGVSSGFTEESLCQIDIVPNDALHLELFWDDGTNDMDLHLGQLESPTGEGTLGANVCAIPADCHFLNRTPIWYPGFAAGEGPNPSLDRDDTDGIGPENITVQAPAAGTYWFGAHFFSDAFERPTLATIRVYLGGQLAFERSRLISSVKTFWYPGQIEWDALGGAQVRVFDAQGRSVQINQCSNPGVALP